MMSGLWGLGSLTGSRAWASRWEHWVWDAGLPENSQLQGILISESSHGGLYPNSRPSSTYLQPPVLYASHQTTRKTGTQIHPSADRLQKVILSSQTPQNTPPDMALPIRGKRLSSTHQNTGMWKPTQATGPTSATGGRDQKQEELWTCSLGKGDLKRRKLDKMRRQRNILQILGAR